MFQVLILFYMLIIHSICFDFFFLFKIHYFSVNLVKNCSTMEASLFLQSKLSIESTMLNSAFGVFHLE